jgi:hypothetical protein
MRLILNFFNIIRFGIGRESLFTFGVEFAEIFVVENRYQRYGKSPRNFQIVPLKGRGVFSKLSKSTKNHQLQLWGVGESPYS